MTRISVEIDVADGYEETAKKAIERFAREAIWLYEPHARPPAPTRGSVCGMISSHCLTPGGNSANGLAAAIVKRFLRRSKYTCFDAEEHWENMRLIGGKMHDKFHHLTSSFHDRLSYFRVDRDEYFKKYGTGDVWIRGRKQSISIHQLGYLRRLKAMVDKTKKLEKKLEAA